MGLIQQNGKSWTVTRMDIHLPQASPLTAMNHGNWRNRADSDSQMRTPGSIHYTALHSLSRKDIETIQNMILTLIDQTRKVVAPSAEEDLACICIDWFRV